MFRKLAYVDVANIPFKGTASAMTDLMAGRVDFVITTGALPFCQRRLKTDPRGVILTSALTPFIRSGKVRPLAVAAHERLPALPAVPIFDEAGVKGFYTDSWYGLVAPANTPRPALEKLNAALDQAFRDPELHTQFSDKGSLPVNVKPTGVDEYWTFVKKQMPIAAEQVRISGAKAD